VAATWQKENANIVAVYWRQQKEQVGCFHKIKVCKQKIIKTTPKTTKTKIDTANAPPKYIGEGEWREKNPAYDQYIADQKPETNLMPKFGTIERYRAQEWLNYISTEVHKGGYSPLWGAESMVTDATARTAFTTVVKENLAKKFDYIESQLTGRDYLMGKNFTVCDAYLFTCFSWSSMIGFDTAGKWPNIAAWNSRVYARPAVQKAMKSEGLLK
jgi:glutathione S-transferase